MTLRRPRAAAWIVAAALLTTPLAAAGTALEAPPQPVEATVPGGDWPAPPAATASAYVLLDPTTGQVLAARDADRRRPVASTVKVLTALSVLDRAALDEVVTVPAEAARVGGAGVGLSAGERWTVQQLLDGLLVRSGNDAAVALAIHVAGSVEAFLQLMRQDAATLGLADVAIVSVNGLDDRNRFSARDLGVITRAALADPRFVTIAAQPAVSLPGLGLQTSRNQLLTSYPGATGVKTGYTEAAGWSVIAAATREGRRLVAVVLDAANEQARFTDAAALLDHGFDAFRPTTARVEVTLRRAGQSHRLSAGPLSLLVPATAPAVELPGDVVPIEWPDASRPLPVRWQGQELAVLELPAPGARRSEVRGSAAVGRFLADRIYAGMRAAHRGDGWPSR